MEVTALCIRLLINVLVLLSPAKTLHSYSHKADSSFPHIVPSRLQFFEYESFFLNCEGLFNDLTEWRVMKNIKGTDTICNNNLEAKIPCNITDSFSADSGTYWCEAEGKKSNTVSILVTAGPVILESPAPVMEGEAVTLRCRNKEKSNLEAGFYKDGVFIRNSSSGGVTIDSVSMSDEGLYRCKFFGVGESAESWLAVGAAPVILESPALPVMEGDAVPLRCRKKSSNHTADFYKDGFLIGNSSTGEMIIHNVSNSNEGLYKCKISGAGESAENRLVVTAGSVILESPALPVMEGDAVTLSCRKKTTSSNLTADFYKDGFLMGSSSTGEMIIHSVSKSDEGLYKCRISGAGESAESWLAVRAHQEISLLPDSSHVFFLLWIVVPVLLLAFLLLLVVGLYMNHKDKDDSWTTIYYHALSTGPKVSCCNTSSLCEYQPTLNIRR